MKVQDFDHANLEELSLYDASTDSDLLQLSPGPLDFRARKAELPGCSYNGIGLARACVRASCCGVRAFGSASLCRVLTHRGFLGEPWITETPT